MESRRVEAFGLLGVPVGSDREAVLHAYRRLARATHPDVSADPAAADRFATLTDAYRLACEVPQGIAGDPAPAGSAGGSVRACVGASEPGDAPPAPVWAVVGPVPMPMAPGAPAQVWRRPPIVAGPVRIRPIPGHARTGGGG